MKTPMIVPPTMVHALRKYHARPTVQTMMTSVCDSSKALSHPSLSERRSE